MRKDRVLEPLIELDDTSGKLWAEWFIQVTEVLTSP